jgi:hypothetical protein
LNCRQALVRASIIHKHQLEIVLIFAASERRLHLLDQLRQHIHASIDRHDDRRLHRPHRPHYPHRPASEAIIEEARNRGATFVLDDDETFHLESPKPLGALIKTIHSDYVGILDALKREVGRA